MNLPTRAQAWELFTEYTKNDALRNHGRAVEQVM
ncbi:MAG: hydrolase, partial [Candidatus Marinimicrobia bacterium]|nr:hydrolase [Candidatus Neomarinimicrobiota bacterium]